MGSNDLEVRPVEAGDPLANEARREVRAKRRHRPGDDYFEFAVNLARACWQAAANDDAGQLGGAI